MKRIVTIVLGASLLAGSLYAGGNHTSEKGMMNHSDMSKGHMAKCEKFMKKYSEENTWTPPRDVLLDFYPPKEFGVGN